MAKMSDYEKEMRNWSRLTKAAFGAKMDGCFSVGYAVRMIYKAYALKTAAGDRLIKFIGAKMEGNVCLFGNDDSAAKVILSRLHRGDGDYWRPAKADHWYQRPHPMIAAKIAKMWGFDTNGTVYFKAKV